MISVFDMSSGDLLQQECCPERWVCRRQKAGRLELGNDCEAGARTYRDERERLLSLELALLPVVASERR